MDFFLRRAKLFLVLAIVASLVGQFAWHKVCLVDVPIGDRFALQGGHDNGGSLLVRQGQKFPMVGYFVGIKPNTEYRACLLVNRSAAASSVVLDFVGTGYDNASQERRFEVVASQSRKKYCFDFNSEAAPIDSGVRVMFDGVGGVMQGDIEVARPTISEVRFAALPSVLNVLAFLCLLGLVGGKVHKASLKSVSIWLFDGRVYWARRALPFLVVVFAALALWVAFGSSTPWVFSDEYSYAWLVKHEGDIAGAERVGLVSTIARSYLFFWIYRPAFHAYSDPYIVAKAINVFFWFFAGYISYLTARRVLGAWLSCLVAVSVFASPWVIYTRLFMPEVLYVFGFWCCALITVSAWKAGSVRGEFGLGVALGALSLVKSHALFLLPGFGVGFLVANVAEAKSQREALRRGIASVATLTVAWYVSKSLMSAAIGPDGGQGGLVGGYGGELARVASLLSDPANAMLTAASVFVRHLGIATLVTGGAWIVVLVVAYEAVFSKRSAQTIPAVERLLFVSAAVSFILLLLITSVFTVAVAGAGPFESVARTHTRYYGFILPYVVVAAVVALQHVQRDPVRGRTLVLLWLTGVSAAVFGLLVRPEHLNANDGPDALALANPSLRFALCAAWAVMLYILLRSTTAWRRAGLLVWACCVGGLNVAIYAVSYYDMTSLPGPGEQVAQAVAARIDQTKRDAGLVVANEAAIDVYRLMFHLNGYSPVIVVKRCDLSQIRAAGDYEWVVTYGFHDGCGDDSRGEVVGEGVRLYRFTSENTQQKSALNSNELGGRLVLGETKDVAVQGGYPPEAWGVWLPPNGYVALSSSVSGDIAVELVAHGYGSNIGRKIQAVLGAQSAEFTLTSEPRKYVFHFSNASPSSNLSFVGLVGESPKEREGQGDTRVLAIGIDSLAVSVKK